jgi:phage terminase Nu1 subunit (DNA packaging protein)
MEQDELMTSAMLADYLRVALRTVERWRAEKRGPPVLWTEGKPRYSKREVDAWLRRNKAEQ